MSPFFHPNFIFLIVSIISIVGGAILVTKLPDFVTPWTVTHKAPLPTGSPRQEYGVGCHSLLQGIFLTQGSNILYRCAPREAHIISISAPKKDVLIDQYFNLFWSIWYQLVKLLFTFLPLTLWRNCSRMGIKPSTL